MYIRSLGGIPHYKINQAIPSLQSTSYDYWWPYPAVGDTPTSTASPTATSVTTPDMDTNPETGSSPTSVPTPSVIQITALPPATASIQAVLPKIPYHRAVNILYLVPLFVALGVLLGTITAVILLKWRRRLLHTSPLLPGPPYVPPENDVEGRLPVHGYPSMEQVSLLAVNTPSKYTVHGSRYTPPVWGALDTARLTHTIIPSSDGERFTVFTEDDPFRVPPNVTAPRQSPTPSNDVSFPTIRIIPSLPKPVEQDTGLPKPFRRSMFDILKLKSASRARKEYAVLVSDDEPADKASASRAHRVTSLKAISPVGRSRFRSARSLDGDDVKQGPTEDPAVYPRWSQHVDEVSPSLGGNITPFTAESSGCGEETDIYTKAPQRRHSRKKPSRCASVPDTHASVLPLSPPLLMSPPLERSLFFTTPLSSSVSLAAHTSSLDPALHLAGTFPVMPSRKTVETRTSRPGSPLPYQPARDTKRVTHQESPTGVSSLGSLSPTSLAIALAASSSADMLSKVNDIVAQGYTKRRSSVGGSG